MPNQKNISWQLFSAQVLKQSEDPLFKELAQFVLQMHKETSKWEELLVYKNLSQDSWLLENESIRMSLQSVSIRDYVDSKADLMSCLLH